MARATAIGERLGRVLRTDRNISGRPLTPTPTAAPVETRGIGDRLSNVLKSDRSGVNPGKPIQGPAQAPVQGPAQAPSAGANALNRGAETATGKGAAGNGGHYAPLTSQAGQDSAKNTDGFIKAGGQGFFSDANKKVADANTTGNRMKNSARWGMGNYQNAANAEGRSALGLAGKHAVQGAGVGAVTGGTIEASQGGSFWDGAKQGAFNGAVGMTAVRGAKRMSGADSYFGKGGKGGIKNSASNMWGSTSNNSKVSKQAVAHLSQTQRDGMTRSFMNQSAKKKATN